MTTDAVASAPERLTSYQRRLVLFLGVASFFEGFDSLALSQLLPRISADFGLGAAREGLVVGAVQLGPLLSCLLVRHADRVGRRRVLSWTIAGYTLFSALSGLAPGPLGFALLQLLAKGFLVAEWAVSMVVVAEEFPASRRGFALGLVQALSSLGGIACAGLVPLLVQMTGSWRGVFWLGSLPLLLLAIWRRNLRETERFAREPPTTPGPLRAIFATPWAGRLWLMSLLWGLTYLCTSNAVTFWKRFVMSERGWSEPQVAGAMTLAAVGALPLVFLVGRLLDGWGRRRAAVVLLAGTALSVTGAYTLHHPAALTLALGGGIVGASAVLPLLNAITTELFPTRLRADAFAWSNNLLGRLGAVLLPILAGPVAARHGWGIVIASSSIGPLIALLLLRRFVAETAGRELEETSRIDSAE